MHNQLPIHFKMNILLAFQWGCYYLFHLWTSHPVYAESSAAIDAYYVNYHKGIIMNKDFCPRLQSNPFNPLMDRSKEIVLGLDEQIHASESSIVDDCEFKVKHPVDGQYETVHFISSFLTFGTNSAGGFGKSIPCHDHIKFQRRAMRKTLIPSAMCSGFKYKSADNSTQMRFDPLMWLNPVNQLGIYFNQSWDRAQINATAHLVFKLHQGNGCEFRVQRYKIDPKCSTADQLGYKSLIANYCEVVECDREHELLKWIQEIPWNWTETKVTTVKPMQPRKKPKYTNWYNDEYEYDDFGWNTYTPGKAGDEKLGAWVFIIILVSLCFTCMCGNSNSTAIDRDPAMVDNEKQTGDIAASGKTPVAVKQHPNASVKFEVSASSLKMNPTNESPTVAGSLEYNSESAKNASSGSANVKPQFDSDADSAPYKIQMHGSVKIEFEQPPY